MDQKTLAYINMFAVFGSLETLCELDEASRKRIEGKNISIGIRVKDGPCGTIRFENGKCRVTEGIDTCTIKLPFSSCEKFNGMIDGTVTPIPSKGFFHINFLLKTFIPLTDRLSAYLRPKEEDMQDPEFFRISTCIMFHLIACAIAQIGNRDKVGKASAGYIVDGGIRLAVKGGPAACIRAKDHVLTVEFGEPQTFMSYMEFSDLTLARQLFDGKVNAVACVGQGLVRIGGMISQVDNINRILDRVSLYLA